MNCKVGIGVASLIVLSLLLALPWAFAEKEGLVLYLPLDGNAEDASGRGNHGQVNGNAIWAEGMLGQALEFDGSTYVEVPDKADSGFDNVSALTVEVWVKQATHHANGIIVKLTAEGVFWPCSYNLETWSDGLATFAVSGEVGKPVAGYPLDEWYHLAGVFDGGTTHLYINGEVTSGKSPATKVPDGDLPVYIGCVTPSKFFFKGSLDELAIYSGALTTEEIIQDMDAGVTISVESKDKLATTWAAVRAQRQFLPGIGVN